MGETVFLGNKKTMLFVSCADSFTWLVLKLCLPFAINRCLATTVWFHQTSFYNLEIEYQHGSITDVSCSA